MSDKMKIWEQVCTPDPKYTKRFKRGGGFSGTATNTQYHVMAATKLWGPNGIGWGYIITQEDYITGAALKDGGNEIIHVIRGYVWYLDDKGEKQQTSEQFYQTVFVGKNKYGTFTDEEAPKKSVTDMLTKCLALLGFSADIFHGLFDDNKYVNDAAAKFKTADPEPDFITSAQVLILSKLADKLGPDDTGKFLKWVGAEDMATIPANKFNQARGALEAKVKALEADK